MHPTPHKALHPEVYDAYVQHGCRAWTVTTHEIETAIRDLILTQRASTTYEAEVRAMLMEKEQFQEERGRRHP